MRQVWQGDRCFGIERTVYLYKSSMWSREAGDSIGVGECSNYGETKLDILRKVSCTLEGF